MKQAAVLLSACMLLITGCGSCSDNSSTPSLPDSGSYSGGYTVPASVGFSDDTVERLVQAAVAYTEYIENQQSLDENSTAFPETAGSSDEADRVIRRASGLQGMAEYLHLLSEIQEPQNSQWKEMFYARLYTAGVNPDFIY